MCFGSRRGVAIISLAVYDVEDLITRKTRTIDVTRRKRYAGALQRTEVLADVLDLADRSTDTYEVVSRIMHIRKLRGIFWFVYNGMVFRTNLEKPPIMDMYEDASHVLREFLNNTKRS